MLKSYPCKGHGGSLVLDVSCGLKSPHDTVLGSPQVHYSCCFCFVLPLYVNISFIYILSSYFMSDCTIHMSGYESLIITLRIDREKWA